MHDIDIVCYHVVLFCEWTIFPLTIFPQHVFFAVKTELLLTVPLILLLIVHVTYYEVSVNVHFLHYTILRRNLYFSIQLNDTDIVLYCILLNYLLTY